MKVVEATRILLREAEEILEEAGLVNIAVEDKDNDSIRYSHGRMEELDFGGKDTTVVYSIDSITSMGKADNDTAARRGVITVDIFTYLDETYPELLELVENIEIAANKRGYNMDLEFKESFSSTRQSVTLMYALSKTII